MKAQTASNKSNSNEYSFIMEKISAVLDSKSLNREIQLDFLPAQETLEKLTKEEYGITVYVMSSEFVSCSIAWGDCIPGVHEEEVDSYTAFSKKAGSISSDIKSKVSSAFKFGKRTLASQMKKISEKLSDSEE